MASMEEPKEELRTWVATRLTVCTPLVSVRSVVTRTPDTTCDPPTYRGLVSFYLPNGWGWGASEVVPGK